MVGMKALSMVVLMGDLRAVSMAVSMVVMMDQQ